MEPNFLITLSSPTAFTTVQRTGTTGSIAITGSAAGTLEARFNGGAWTTLGAAAGNFSFTLSNQAQGQGSLEVRYLNDDASKVTVANIGIGDVFIFAFQSNHSGRGLNNQVYSHATLKATLFGNDYVWKELADPYDSATNQVDTISSDTSPAAAGSYIPLLATLIMADQGVPVAFVPAARGATTIADWLPAADHLDRSTFYGSMNYRAHQTGAKAVLWWGGESDAIAGTSQATFNSRVDTVANAVMTDLGVSSFFCQLQDCTGFDVTTVNLAIAEAWGNNANTPAAADFSDIVPADGTHLATDAELELAADRWWAALEAVLYP